MPPRAMSRKRRWNPRNSDPTTRNIPYSGCGYSEDGEDGVQAEADSNLCGCEKVGLEHTVVEDTERVHNHGMVLIDSGLVNGIHELFVCLKPYRL